MSELWDPIFGRSAIAAVLSDRAWIAALTRVEAGLATACAAVGLIDADTAQVIGRACEEAAGSDPREWGELAAADGNPVIPLVRAIRVVAGPAAASSVHLGATSQDILDTAMMLLCRESLGVIGTALDAGLADCVRLAAGHRETAMAGRTLLQQAVPTTFGATAAGWGDGLARAARRLRELASALPVQLGGAAGTMAGWYPHGPAVRAAFAAALGLADPGTTWHTERSRIAELAGALGAACAAIGKPATDIVLLAQTELGEVREGAGGGSSTMAHKHNPIAAVTARAGALQAPGLVATLVAAAGLPELQRGAGPWHAEWQPLTALLATTAGSATRLAASLAGLLVDPVAMAGNLDRLDAAPDVGHAIDIADSFVREHS